VIWRINLGRLGIAACIDAGTASAGINASAVRTPRRFFIIALSICDIAFQPLVGKGLPTYAKIFS
jgi:hypothetical protein